MDMKEWFRVVDHSKYFCRSWQFLYFPEIVVKYIRIIGTHNTVNRLFHVVAFQAYYMPDPLPTSNGFIGKRIDNFVFGNTFVFGVLMTRIRILSFTCFSIMIRKTQSYV